VAARAALTGPVARRAGYRHCRSPAPTHRARRRLEPIGRMSMTAMIVATYPGKARRSRCCKWRAGWSSVGTRSSLWRAAVSRMRLVPRVPGSSRRPGRRTTTTVGLTRRSRSGRVGLLVWTGTIPFDVLLPKADLPVTNGGFGSTQQARSGLCAGEARRPADRHAPRPPGPPEDPRPGARAGRAPRQTGQWRFLVAVHLGTFGCWRAGGGHRPLLGDKSAAFGGQRRVNVHRARLLRAREVAVNAAPPTRQACPRSTRSTAEPAAHNTTTCNI